MTFNANRERLRKEKANHDVIVQSTIKYDSECKYKGSRHLTQEEINKFVSLPVELQNTYLQSIGKFEMEDC